MELIFNGFDQMTEKYPDNVAVIYLGEKFTYRELKELSLRFASSLKELGVNKGDKVMLYIPNSIQWVIAFLGILRIGAVVVPVSPIYTSYEIRYMLNDCRAETIICQDTNFCYVADIIDKTPLKRVIVTNLADLLPWWKRLVGYLFDKIPEGKVKKERGIHYLLEERSLDSLPPESRENLDFCTNIDTFLGEQDYFGKKVSRL